MDNKKEQEAYKNLKNNAYGRSFEQGIEFACKHYIDDGLAAVSKTPEPFRVLKKFKGGIFRGQFTARAHPDFKGTVKGGRSIIFEAKYTSTEVIKKKSYNRKTSGSIRRTFKAWSNSGRMCRNTRPLLFRAVGYLAKYERDYRQTIRKGRRP